MWVVRPTFPRLRRQCNHIIICLCEIIAAEVPTTARGARTYYRRIHRRRVRVILSLTEAAATRVISADLAKGRRLRLGKCAGTTTAPMATRPQWDPDRLNGKHCARAADDDDDDGLYARPETSR